MDLILLYESYCPSSTILGGKEKSEVMKEGLPHGAASEERPIPNTDLQGGLPPRDEGSQGPVFHPCNKSSTHASIHPPSTHSSIQCTLTEHLVSDRDREQQESLTRMKTLPLQLEKPKSREQWNKLLISRGSARGAHRASAQRYAFLQTPCKNRVEKHRLKA